MNFLNFVLRFIDIYLFIPKISKVRVHFLLRGVDRFDKWLDHMLNAFLVIRVSYNFTPRSSEEIIRKKYSLFHLFFSYWEIKLYLFQSNLWQVHFSTFILTIRRSNKIKNREFDISFTTKSIVDLRISSMSPAIKRSFIPYHVLS